MPSPLLALLIAAAPPPADPVAARVAAVLRRTPVIDGHNDLPWEITERFGGRIPDLAAGTAALPRAPGQAPLMTDIPRLRAGGVGGQFWSVYIPATITGPAAVAATLTQIDVVKRMAARFPADLAMAYSAADVVRAERAGRIASLIGIEGGHQIGDSLAVLRQLYDAGARYMTLTHSADTGWADSATDAPRHHGLAPFGVAVVREMNRLGMLVDLSHVSAGTMRAAIAASAAPVIFSHSSARALTDHARDVPDDVLALVARNRGLVMVNFYPPFVSEARRRWEAARDGARAEADALHRGAPDRAAAALAAWDAAHPRPEATPEMIADHVEHIARACGHDCVGLGADYDGVPAVPPALADVSRYPALLAVLARRGWSDANLERLAGGNLLRVMRATEAVAASMRALPPGDAVFAPPDGASPGSGAPGK